MEHCFLSEADVESTAWTSQTVLGFVGDPQEVTWLVRLFLTQANGFWRLNTMYWRWSLPDFVPCDTLFPDLSFIEDMSEKSCCWKNQCRLSTQKMGKVFDGSWECAESKTKATLQQPGRFYNTSVKLFRSLRGYYAGRSRCIGHVQHGVRKAGRRICGGPLARGRLTGRDIFRFLLWNMQEINSRSMKWVFRLRIPNGRLTRKLLIGYYIVKTAAFAHSE